MSAKARGALCLLAAAAAIAALPSGAAAKPAHLRLIAPAARVGAHAFRHRVSLSQLGIELGAFRAPLEIHVWRPRYSRPFRAAIVDGRSGAVIRRIPRGFLASNSAGGGFVGVPQEPAKRPPKPPFPRLRGFLHVVFHAHGKVAARGAMPLCPSGLRERVNGGGPDVSRYPPTCSSFSPFVRGLVWGIDRDWAAGILDSGGPDPKVKIDRGRYRVTARISKPYRHIFGISRHHATARLRVYVHGGGPVGGGGKRAAATMGAPPPPVPQAGRVPRRPRPHPVAPPAWNPQTRPPPPAGTWHTARRAAHAPPPFSATKGTAAPAPLDVGGSPPAGHAGRGACDYSPTRRGRVVGREPAGHLEFDSRHGHKHWHFE